MQKSNSYCLKTISINGKSSSLMKLDDMFNYLNETITELELLLVPDKFGDIFVDINGKNIDIN
jgi:hypothetical protein